MIRSIRQPLSRLYLLAIAAAVCGGIAMAVLHSSSPAHAQDPDPPTETSVEAQESCSRGGDDPKATPVEVVAVPIVVESTTDEYFVLYVRHDLDADTTQELPVAVVVGEEGTTTLAENVAALPSERYRAEKYLVANPADVDGDCIDDITELQNLGSMNPVNPAAAIDLSDGAAALPDRDTFEDLSYNLPILDNSPDGFEYLKFLLFDMDTDQPGIYFMKTSQNVHHRDFMDAVGLEWDQVIRGVIAYNSELTAPDGSPGVYSYWLVPFSSSYPFSLTDRSYTILAANLELLDDDLALYLRNDRLPFSQDDLALYRESRLNLVFDEDIYPETSFQALNPGEGYGLLRVRDPDERPHPREIVVYEALPNELPRVAGIITTAPQTPLSHVNLRAVQDGVPNAFIRDAFDDTDFHSLFGGYVHYTVTEDGWTLRSATTDEVEAHYAASQPATEQTPQRDLTITQVTALSDIEFDDWTAFGVKAANVAVLRALDFPIPQTHVPNGFAVPFYFYDEFMKHNGFYDDIIEMLADSDFQSDFDTQEDQLKKLRKKIKKGETPEQMTEALEVMHAAFPEGTSLRYRSSTNNEDLPGFNGAGLYDSKTQHPEETEEDGIAKSLKQVYAGLWNFRAFTEREFHRVDHLAAAMGVLVHPNYSDELANGVAVTFDPIYGKAGSYYVNTQLGEDLVTNPEAHSVPEEIVLNSTGSFIVLATSNLLPPGELLLSLEKLDQLREHLAVIHEEFEELYDPEPGEPFAMEIEFKITSDNILSIKQARPWVFSHGEAAPSNRNIQATGAPTIDGIARVSQTLTADTSGIDDEDELTNVAFSYQWLADDADIAGATGATYTLVAADEGRAIKVVVSFTDDRGNEETLASEPTGAVAPDPGPLTAFTLVDASTDPDTLLETLEDGDTLTLAAPDSDIYGIRVDTDSNHDDHDDIQKVVLALSGAKTEGKTEWEPPYSLYGDSGGDNLTGEALPVGSYTLTATAYDANGDVLGTLTVSFSVEAQEQTAVPNNEPTGAPAITGTAQVGETLTANVTGIADEDGLENAEFTYQWIRNDGTEDADIAGATGDTYTPDENDVGKTLKVRVSFTNDADHGETLTSPPTAAVTAPPLTATLDSVPASHDGSTEFTFELHFSEEFKLSYTVLRDYAFTVTGGTVSRATRVDKGFNIKRKIHVQPDGDGAVTIVLPVTTDCADDGAICTVDGRKLSTRLERTVSGPGGAPTTTNEPAPNTQATGQPTIDGAARVGETLTADTSGIHDDDGLTNVAFSYQWVRSDGSGDSNIQDATGSSYTLVKADEGKTIKVTVSFTDAEGNPESLTSDPTGEVGGQAQHSGHGFAHHQRHGPGGRDADGGHLGHQRRGWAESSCVQLPVDQERRERRRGHRRSYRLQLHPY